KKESVEALLKVGANPNARVKSGETPLHWAANLGLGELVQLLLSYQADVNAQDNQGRTALDMVRQGSSSGDGGRLILSGSPLRLPSLPTRVSSASPGGVARSATDTAELLRARGGLTDLPRPDCIYVRRPTASFTAEIFRNSTNDWNHYTLLETI